MHIFTHRVSYSFFEVKTMYKTSDFLHRQVLSLADARLIGRIDDVLFDNAAKAAIYLAVNADGKLYLIEFDKILSHLDVLVVDSALSLIDACDVDMTALVSLDGKEIFSQNGESKGEVLCVELFANGKTSKIVTESASYSPSAFQTVGDVLLMRQAKKRTIRRTIPRDKTNRKVELLDVPTPNNDTQIVEVAEIKSAVAFENNLPLFSQDALEKIVGKEVVYQDDDERTPARVITDYDFLLGRTLLHDLLTYAGTLIAKQGTIVTKDLVETASRYGKLVDLTLNSSYK